MLNGWLNNLTSLGFLIFFFSFYLFLCSIQKDTGWKLSVTAAIVPQFVAVTDAKRLLLWRPDPVPHRPPLPGEFYQGSPAGCPMFLLTNIDMSASHEDDLAESLAANDGSRSRNCDASVSWQRACTAWPPACTVCHATYLTAQTSLLLTCWTCSEAVSCHMWYGCSHECKLQSVSMYVLFCKFMCTDVCYWSWSGALSESAVECCLVALIIPHQLGTICWLVHYGFTGPTGPEQDQRLYSLLFTDVWLDGVSVDFAWD